MAVFIREGETIEGAKCTISTRKILFKKGGLRKDPITNKNMVIYELDRNSTVKVSDVLDMSEEEKAIRDRLNIHYNLGDSLTADAIRLYVDSKRDCLKVIVKEGQSARHGANLANSNVRTIGKIKTPLAIYNNLLGHSAKKINLTNE